MKKFLFYIIVILSTTTVNAQCNICLGRKRIVRTETCNHCYGKGSFTETITKNCQNCYGRGYTTHPCSTCSGRGLIDDPQTCPTCNGSPYRTEELECNNCKGYGAIITNISGKI